MKAGEPGNRKFGGNGFEFRILPDVETASAEAAILLTQQIAKNPDTLLCAATGGSPTRTYQLFVQAMTTRSDRAERLAVLKLDEWSGLKVDDPATCEHYLRRHLVEPLGLDPEQYQGFRSDTNAPEAECARIRDWLRARAPIDLCVLGLGLNGHLGLNEPGPTLSPFCHAPALAETTLRHPMLQMARTAPAGGMTLGMNEILCSSRILLLVFGAAKADVLCRLMDPVVSTHFPASFLWLHSNVTCLCDQAAAQKLERG